MGKLHFASILLTVALFATGCQTPNINFDEFPDGTAVAPFGSGSPDVITTQYASVGVLEFDPEGSGALLAVADASAPSQPNHVCVMEATAWVGTPTKVTLKETTCNVWLSVTLGQPTIRVLDINGNELESRSVGIGRHRFNQCGIKTVRVEGASIAAGDRYCFDDFEFEKN